MALLKIRLYAVRPNLTFEFRPFVINPTYNDNDDYNKQGVVHKLCYTSLNPSLPVSNNSYTYYFYSSHTQGMLKNITNHQRYVIIEKIAIYIFLTIYVGIEVKL